MASVVDTSVKHFHSAMAGAPVLNGVAGSLIALLDACLKDGFDTKAATSLVVSDGVATLSFAGSHSATVDSVILVSGVTGALIALNGEQKTTALGAGQVKFATDAADGAAAGTVSFKMAPAGWLKPFAGTNLAVYKSADPASTGMSLRVDDTATMQARVVGYESMTDVNTGTGAFPTSAQQSGGGYWHKSSVASVAAIPWILVCDSRKFILHIASNFATNATYTVGHTRGFGDDFAFRPGGDPYACSLNYALTSTVNSSDGSLDGLPVAQHAFPRAFTGLGSCVLHLLYPYTGTGTSGSDSTLGSFPSAVDGGLRLCRKYFAVTATSPPRAELPGLYHLPVSGTSTSFAARDIVLGTGALAGRKLLAFTPGPSLGAAPSATSGVSLLDITGPWR